MKNSERICGNCIHFTPVVKRGENGVDVVDEEEGRCRYWRRDEWDVVNRLNGKLSRSPQRPRMRKRLYYR